MKTFDISTKQHPDAIMILDDAIHGAMLYALRRGDFTIHLHQRKQGPRTVRIYRKSGKTEAFSAFLLPSAKKVTHLNGDPLDYRLENLEAEYPPRLAPIPTDGENIPTEERPQYPLNSELERNSKGVTLRADGRKGQWWGVILTPSDWELVREMQLAGSAGPITTGLDGNGRRVAWITICEDGSEHKTRRLLHPMLSDRKKVRFKNGNGLDLRQENINY